MTTQWRCWVPVLRVKDARASARFYCDLLETEKDWEHQFDDEFPRYISVSRDALTLHLSKHGDRSDSGILVVSVEDVDAAYTEICDRGLKSLGPPENRSYDVRDFAIADPDGPHLESLRGKRQ